LPCPRPGPASGPTSISQRRNGGNQTEVRPPGPGPRRGRLQPISDGVAGADLRSDHRGRDRVGADINQSATDRWEPTSGPTTGAGPVSGPASTNQRRHRREPTSGPTTGAGTASGPTSTSQRRIGGSRPQVRPPEPGPRQGRHQPISDGAAGNRSEVRRLWPGPCRGRPQPLSDGAAGAGPGPCRRCRPVVGAGRAVDRPGLTPPLIEGRALAAHTAVGPNPQARFRDRAGNARAPQVRLTQPMVKPRHVLPPPSSASLPVLRLASYPGSLAGPGLARTSPGTLPSRARPYGHPVLRARSSDTRPVSRGSPHRPGCAPVPAVRSPALRPLPSERVAAPGRWWCFPARTSQVRVRGCCCHASGVAESGPLMPDLA
jgi:hypothetical protein